VIKRIRSTKIVACDVDKTLIFLPGEYPPNTPKKLLITIKNKKGLKVKALPHYRHIEMLKNFAVRGHTVVVWSAGSEEWAFYICKILKLTNVVDYTMDKFDWYFDDLLPQQFMKGRIYLDPFDSSKDTSDHILKK